MELRKRNCPMCGGRPEDSVTKYTREFPDNGPQVVRCYECHLTYLSPVMTDKEYEKFYNRDAQKTFAQSIVNEDYDLKISHSDQRRVNLVKKNIKPNSRILDIGTGNSNFVGLVDNAIGIDISVPRVEAAKKRGLNVRHCNIFDWNETVDVVTMFHVLEHITEPTRFIMKVMKILSNNGILIVEVPNLNDLLVRLNKYSNFYYQNAHCTYFTPRTLRSFLTSCGFNILDEIRLQRYSLDNHLHWLFMGKPGKINSIKFCNNIYSRALKIIRKHDTIFMVCRKEQYDE